MGLWNEFIKWKETFESRGLRVNLENILVMLSGDITKDGMSKVKLIHVGSAP